MGPAALDDFAPDRVPDLPTPEKRLGDQPDLDREWCRMAFHAHPPPVRTPNWWRRAGRMPALSLRLVSKWDAFTHRYWPLETAVIIPDPGGGFLHVSRAIELDEERLVALEDRHRPWAVRP